MKKIACIEQKCRHCEERTTEASKKAAFTLAEGTSYCTLLPTKVRFGFTLVEVLITLGIIGVVAAMTIPNLMTKFAKMRVENKVKGFYSNINQAMRLSQEENGDMDGWIELHKNYTYEETVEFIKKYIAPYIKVSGYRDCAIGTQNLVCLDLLDGGLMSIAINERGGDIIYLIDGKWEKRDINPSRNRFSFQFAKTVSSHDTTMNSTNFVDTYVHEWDGTRNGLVDPSVNYACKPGCVSCKYCAKLIQMNGWKIPDNYPW